MQLFFGLAVCSWVPHWSCHYYRLETGSGFAVGSWHFTRLDSWVSLLVYGLLIASNLASIVLVKVRWVTAAISGSLHVMIGGLHLFRLVVPFRFEVFDFAWSQQASLGRRQRLRPWSSVPVGSEKSVSSLFEEPVARSFSRGWGARPTPGR